MRHLDLSNASNSAAGKAMPPIKYEDKTDFQIKEELSLVDCEKFIKSEWADEHSFIDIDIALSPEEGEFSDVYDSPKKPNEIRKNKRKALTPQRAIQTENSQSGSFGQSSDCSQDASDVFLSIPPNIFESKYLANDIYDHIINSDTELPEDEDLLRDIDEENIFKGIEEETDGEKLDTELIENVKEEWRSHWGIKCNICEQVFPAKSDFDSHYKNTYNVSPIYSCSFCNKSSIKFSSFRSHCYRHITEGRYKCEECPKGFSLQSMLQLHIVAKHSKTKTFVCDECGKDFITKQGLASHTKKHKNESKEEFPCLVCNKILHTRGGLTSHMNVHRLGRRFMCDICGKTFTQKVNMQQHAKSHTGDKPHECDKCGKTFAEKSHLARHYSFHSEQRPFKCEVCQKMYKTERCLKVHSMVHAKERPYICTHCNKGFLSSTKLKQHYNIHTGERPFECKYCERKFTNYPNWLKHTRRRHKVDHITGQTIPDNDNPMKSELGTSLSSPVTTSTKQKLPSLSTITTLPSSLTNNTQFSIASTSNTQQPSLSSEISQNSSLSSSITQQAIPSTKNKQYYSSLSNNNTAVSVLDSKNGLSSLLSVNSTITSSLVSNNDLSAAFVTKNSPTATLTNKDSSLLTLLTTNNQYNGLSANQNNLSSSVENHNNVALLQTSNNTVTINNSPYTTMSTNNTQYPSLSTNNGLYSSLVTNNALCSSLVTNNALSSPLVTNNALSSSMVTNKPLPSSKVNNKSLSSSTVTKKTVVSPLVTNKTASSSFITNYTLPSSLTTPTSDNTTSSSRINNSLATITACPIPSLLRDRLVNNTDTVMPSSSQSLATITAVPNMTELLMADDSVSNLDENTFDSCVTAATPQPLDYSIGNSVLVSDDSFVSGAPDVDSNTVLIPDIVFSDVPLTKTEEFLLQQGFYNYPIGEEKYQVGSQQAMEFFGASSSSHGILPPFVHNHALPSTQQLLSPTIGATGSQLNEFNTTLQYYVQHPLPL